MAVLNLSYIFCIIELCVILLLAGFFQSGNESEVREIDVCHVPVFTILQWLLPKHNSIPEVYLLLMAMLMGQQVNQIPLDVQVIYLRV